MRLNDMVKRGKIEGMLFWLLCDGLFCVMVCVYRCVVGVCCAGFVVCVCLHLVVDSRLGCLKCTSILYVLLLDVLLDGWIRCVVFSMPFIMGHVDGAVIFTNVVL